MNYWFSPSENSFYSESLKASYIAAGNFPDDLKEISDETFIEFTGSSPEGKTRGFAEDGYPLWVDIPPLTPEEEAKAAKQKKAAFLSDAYSVIGLWQTELQLGVISDEDKASLLVWLAYIKELQGIDPDAAPNINWPEIPAS